MSKAYYVLSKIRVILINAFIFYQTIIISCRKTISLCSRNMMLCQCRILTCRINVLFGLSFVIFSSNTVLLCLTTALFCQKTIILSQKYMLTQTTMSCRKYVLLWLNTIPTSLKKHINMFNYFVVFLNDIIFGRKHLLIF